MPTSLADVKGIGPSNAKDLQAHGMESAEDLASASLAEIVAVPGFGEARAKAVKDAAIQLVRGVAEPKKDAPDPNRAGAEGTGKPKKAKKSKKDKEKGKKKNKKKDKKKN